MKTFEISSKLVPRRGFLRNLILAVTGTMGLRIIGEPKLEEPKEKELREADFYKKHNLAG